MSGENVSKICKKIDLETTPLKSQFFNIPFEFE